MNQDQVKSVYVGGLVSNTNTAELQKFFEELNIGTVSFNCLIDLWQDSHQSQNSFHSHAAIGTMQTCNMLLLIWFCA